MAHVVYALSPGGVERSVDRTTRWRGRGRARVAGSPVDPDDLEAMLFLESAGRPTVMADGTPRERHGADADHPVDRRRRCSGCAWISARSLEINRALAREQRRAVLVARRRRSGAPHGASVRRLVRERKVVDERFDPQKSLEAAVRYLRIARRRFGRDDLAIASYHMGIGNLRTVIDTLRRPACVARAPRGGRSALRALVAAPLLRLVAHAQPAHVEAPDRRSATTRATTSSRCWHRGRSCGCARTDPRRARAAIELQTAKASAEELLRPESRYPPYEDNEDLRAPTSAASSCRCRTTPCGWATGSAAAWARSRSGSTSRGSSTAACGPKRSRRCCTSSKEYRRIAGHGHAARDEHGARPALPGAACRRRTSRRRASSRSTRPASQSTSPSRARRRRCASCSSGCRRSNVIAWVEEPGAFHLTVGPEAEAFMPIYEALVVDRGRCCARFYRRTR